MKLETIIKGIGITLLVGGVLYKVTTDYLVKDVEKDFNKYMTRLREAGL